MVLPEGLAGRRPRVLNRPGNDPEEFIAIQGVIDVPKIGLKLHILPLLG